MKIACFCLFLVLTAQAGAYTHLEPRQQHPITLTPDGTRLLALHSTAHSLSVFDVGSPPRATPLLISEIPLSTAPVTVKARTNDEVWIVNEGADSVSIVSLSKSTIIDTLRVADEPADVVFANGKAFVSSAQARTISVFDTSTRNLLAQIPVDGVAPRALTASSDGSRLYVACLYSGNRTTILNSYQAPAQPAPTNTSLPPAPEVGLIVPASDSRVTWNVRDHDIAEINTSTHNITRWITDVGTNLFALAVHPDGTLWCANSNSDNLTRFEPALNGDFVDHRLSRIALPATSVTHHDLNSGIPRATTPDPASIAQALAAPMAFTIKNDGQSAWIAAFNSDRVAEIELATGTILRRIDLRPSGAGTSAMRGPRGLALGEHRLYVLNKISDTLSTIRLSDGTLLSDIPLGSTDPMPAHIRAGRGVLYDARLSGNGAISCATCHIDADRDGLAWDLGDPGGSMVTVTSANLSAHDFSLYTQNLHPMKGPLITQTLRGLATNDAPPNDPTDGFPHPPQATATKFHWRGDKPSIQSFNSTFPNLMGGTLQSGASMDQLNDYLRSIVLAPNPNLNLDRSLRTNLPQGNALFGKNVFLDHGNSHCIVCHAPPAGTNQNIDDPELVDVFQPMKNPSLRTVYQRFGIFNPGTGATSLSGFGLGSDGSRHAMPIVHPYFLSTINQEPVDQATLDNLTAFILSFDTGTAPSATHDLTLNFSNNNQAGLLSQLSVLESRSALGENGLVANGMLGGMTARFRWDAQNSLYLSADGTTSHSRAALLALLGNGDSLTFAGVLPSETAWRSTDRDGDGHPDLTAPPPTLTIERDSSGLFLRWPKTDWTPVTSPDLSTPWQPAPGDPVSTDTWWHLPVPLDSPPTGFYRLHRTW